MGGIKPFLKWAGGKRWLVSQHKEIFSCDCNTYYEPFLGSGAVYFALAPRIAFLSDSNRALIETYQAIKTNWQSVVKHLRKHQANHCTEYYYQVRQNCPQGLYARAARFIYLNRTCWNGLYRVNLHGVFNVPIGTKSNIVSPDDDYGQISYILQSAELRCLDFECVINRTTKGDFVYIDPPYTINHSNNGFIKYNELLFSWSDQLRLRDAVVRAVTRGARVVISNAFHPAVADLYKDSFELHVISRTSRLSGKTTGRKKGNEYLIVGV
jgi:DNA adenine methylase